MVLVVFLSVLFSRRKITILKAIHNYGFITIDPLIPVFAPKNYNFESNSQPAWDASNFSFACFRAEKLQFWKQFTTQIVVDLSAATLFSRRKITILKAIHNVYIDYFRDQNPVFAPKNYNFESNSQLQWCWSCS